MRLRPLAHRLLALVMGVLALQLTLWEADPACATGSTTTAPAFGRAAAAAAGHGAAGHGGAHAIRHAAAADAAGSTAAGASAPESAPAPDCQMPAAIGGCTASMCATVAPALGVLIVGASTVTVDAAAAWPPSVHAPTRPLVPDVPPPKA